MASHAEHIPAYLLSPNAKPEVIAWINRFHFPSRFARALLQRWGEHTGVILTPADYAQVGIVGHT